MIAAREGRRGPEVIVVRRAEDSRFLPGYVAFPGGAIEPRDAALAERWFGSRSEATRACAVRELSEEAGLALTAEGLRAVEGGEPMAAVDAAPPPPAALARISRWIAPRSAPVRFDATFFAVRCDGGVEPRAASPEVAAVWWARPAELLERWAAGGIRLLWPTMKLIEGLAGCRDVEGILAARIPQQEPVEPEGSGLPRSTFLPGP